MTHSLMKPFDPFLYDLYAIMIVRPNFSIAMYTPIVVLCVYFFVKWFIQSHSKAATKVVLSNRVMVQGG